MDPSRRLRRAALLDILEAVALRFCADEKVAKKAMKDLIKLSVKLGLL